MDCCCDCTTDMTGTDVAQYPEATDVVTYPEATDVVVEFPALNEGTTVTLPNDTPESWGVATTPAATTPAPSIPYADPFVQSMANDMFIDAINSQGVAMTNLTSPYSSDYTFSYDSSTNSSGWTRDGDMTFSTPTTYDD
jgi:hypothetical protein